MKSVGQGSSATIPVDAKGFGMPGLFVECISVANRKWPPIVGPAVFSPDCMVTEEGRAGKAGVRAVYGTVEGVPGDMSEASSRFDRDMLRAFILRRLDEEKFLCSLAVGEPARVAWCSSLSRGPRDANGEPSGRGSDGLGSTGGDDGLRMIGLWLASCAPDVFGRCCSGARLLGPCAFNLDVSIFSSLGF
jgi:hypothetical protein